MRVAMVINARNKAKYIARAVCGALSQTVPCEIILSDQVSTDGTYEVMEQTAKEYGPTHHAVRLVRCPIGGEYGMAAMNAHFHWVCQQVSDDCEWIFQCSGDDYSLPRRVEVCMQAIEQLAAQGLKPSAICTTQFFERPGETNRTNMSGYPRQSGFVKAGEGLLNLAYGSVIAGYSREFLDRVSNKAGDVTPDVLFGYLAALDGGFYVVCDPQHVHGEIADTQNTGFQGKMAGATGDELERFKELNHYQLCKLYFKCATVAQELYEGIQGDDWNALMNMIVGQAHGWLNERSNLHQKRIMPGILP